MALHVLVVGGGAVGTYLASLLLASGHMVQVIEAQETEIPRLQQALAGARVVQGSGTDPAVLEAAGIRQAQVVAAVTGADETNLVITSLARFAFRVPRTIARVNLPGNVWMFTALMGVDVALNQADLLAHVIAEEMSLGDMMTLLRLRRGKFSLVEEKIPPGAKAVGIAIKDLPIPDQCVIAAIIRKGEILIPRGVTQFEVGDEVFAIAVPQAADELAQFFCRPPN